MFCLTLVAFVCHSLIPVGFMPDSSPARDGRAAITFCLADGEMSTGFVNLSDKSDQGSDHDATTSTSCPFGLLAMQAVIPPVNVTVFMAAVLQRELPALVDNITLPPLPAQGPPLGSRAPPSNLG